MSSLLVDQIYQHWQQINPQLKRILQANDKGGYSSPFKEESEAIDLFMLKSILQLFTQEDLELIEQHIKVLSVLLKGIEESKPKHWIMEDEQVLVDIRTQLEALERVLNTKGTTISFLAENNQIIQAVFQEKINEIDQKAKLLFEEKLPRYLSSAFEKEAKALKKGVVFRERCFFVALISISALLLYLAKESYISYVAILFPSIWGLWLLTKKINQDTRLLHEYKHKAVLARTYTLYVDQLGNHLDRLFFTDENRIAYQDLMYSFLNENVKALIRNPAVTLGKEDKGTPYAAILDKIINQLSLKKNQG